MKTLHIDVMILGGAKHYCSLTYQYNPLFGVKPDDIGRFVYEKRPTLKYRNDVMIIVDN